MQSEASTVFLRLTMTELIQAFFFFKKEKRKEYFYLLLSYQSAVGQPPKINVQLFFFFFLIPILLVVMFPLQNEVLISFDWQSLDKGFRGDPVAYRATILGY